MENKQNADRYGADFVHAEMHARFACAVLQEAELEKNGIWKKGLGLKERIALRCCDILEAMREFAFAKPKRRAFLYRLRVNKLYKKIIRAFKD